MSSSELLTPFGAPMLKHFLFEPGWRNLNQGSFGTYPAPVRDALRKFQDANEARPDAFFRWELPKGLDVSRAAVAKLLHVPTEECVFVKNATTGVNTVLRNLLFKEGDVIVYFATVYGAIEKTIVSLSEMTPVRGLKVEYRYPISDDELVRRFEETVTKAKADGLNVRVAVFDTVVSNPGIRFPFEELVRVCKEQGVLSLIDGAHGIGQIPLDLGKLQPDFFTSNCHKWLFTPRGCAVLYVPLRNQHLIRTTLPTSWGFIPDPNSPATQPSVLPSGRNPKSAFELLFQFVATGDDTPYLCVPAALEFRQTVCGGEDRIYEYMENLAREAGDVVSLALGTEVLQEPGLKPGEVSRQRQCAMATVRLPLAVSDHDSTTRTAYPVLKTTDALAAIDWMQAVMANKYKTLAPIFLHGGWLWVRLSAQIYLEKSDFEWLGGVLKVLCEKVGNREMDEESRGDV
ncbi:hypothetical protein VTN00DRAFT_6821 [Thermoascus crustaceus]|uniref:uncharacterized protein n=1 Tax=Thermoascus crustaceus TaxID=5088 RepID=UPI0037449373